MVNILIIEDDDVFGEMLSMYLREECYLVNRSATVGNGIAALLESPPDVILLDLMLPDTMGQNPCSMIREHTDAPIIVISTASKVSERIYSLGLGADDYLCKPFSLQELKARIDAILRRTGSKESIGLPSCKSYTDAAIRLAADQRQVILNGQIVETTYSEFELFRLLFTNPGKVFSRDQLINAIRGNESFVNDRTIDVHITNLRRKIEQQPREPHYIKTVWGVGYKFVL